MTPALKLLKKNNSPHKIFGYTHDPKCTNYGEEIIKALNIKPSKIFKTLIFKTVKNTPTFYVAIVPVNFHLDLKLAAKAVKTKKVEMASAEEAENITGYKTGGISPLGQKKRLYTILDDYADNFKTIFVSAGKRGLELEVEPKILKTLLDCHIKKIRKF